MLYVIPEKTVDAWCAPENTTIGNVAVRAGDWVIHPITITGDMATLEDRFTVMSKEEFNASGAHPQGVGIAPTANRNRRGTLEVPPARTLPGSTLANQIAGILTAHKGTPMTSKAIATELGVDSAKVSATLSRMKKNKTVTTKGRGNFALRAAAR